MVLSVAFSPGGQHISSASRDHTILVWDATMGEMPNPGGAVAEKQV